MRIQIHIHTHAQRQQSECTRSGGNAMPETEFMRSFEIYLSVMCNCYCNVIAVLR